MVSINIIWIQHRYRYYILYCNFYITLKFVNIFSIVCGIIKIMTVCSVIRCALRATEAVHGFLYHSFVHALWPRQLSLSVQVSISAIDCARFRSTTVYRTSKFMRQGRVHCCRTATTQSLAYEKLRRICCFDLIFCENSTVKIIRFSF